MLLDRVPGQPANALVDPRGQAAREFVCAWPPLVPTPSTARRLRPAATARRGRLPGPNVFRGKQREGHKMGMYCLRALIPVHTAGAGEIMEILWSDYYGAVLFGEGGGMVGIRTKGFGLEAV